MLKSVLKSCASCSLFNSLGHGPPNVLQ